MKQKVIHFILIIPALCAFYGFRHQANNNRSVNLKKDTLTGFFLYEINVPLMCYSRFDQIEQGHSLIYYSDSIANKDIADQYRKGMFFYSVGDSIFKKAHKNGISTLQKSESIWGFVRSTAPYLNDAYTTNNKFLIYDKSKNLTYVKVHATIVVEKIGKIKWLIPKTTEYTCCYSNLSEEVETYLIKDFIEFKVY